MKQESKIKVGMDYSAVVAVLGQPTATNPGSEMISGAGLRVHASTETRAHLFHTNFCLWRRPEGEYQLVFEYGRLAKIHSAPPGSVVKNDEGDNSERLLGRIVIIAFAEAPTDPAEACRQALSDASIELREDSILNCRVSAHAAVNSSEEGCLAYLMTGALMEKEKDGLSDDEINFDEARLIRFRTKEGAAQWNAGVMFVVPPR